MTIETKQQTIEVSDVGSVTVTDVVQDTENNVYVREIRVYDVASESGTSSLLFTLRLSADTSARIAMSAPAQTY